MKKYIIKGVDLIYYDSFSRFSGFVLDGVIGTVDVFVDGYLDWEDFGIQNIEDELKWAYSKVGSSIYVEDLVYKAIATRGKVLFKEKKCHQKIQR